MSKPVLVAYSTWAGSTTGVAEAIAEGIRSAGLEAEVRRASDVGSLEPYGALVVGAPVHAGRPHPGTAGLFARHGDAIGARPLALFIVCMTMKDDTEENREAASGFLEPVLARFPELSPVDIGLFAGAIPGDDASRRRLSWLARFMLKVTRAEEGDFRDPGAARAWGRALAVEHLGGDGTQ